jgi:YidC/Oxa1 family membrane protein insertase
MQNEQRNMFLAIGLSLAVVMLWQFLTMPSADERAAVEAERAAAEQLVADEGLPAPAGSVPQSLDGSEALVVDRDAALRLTPRIPIDTPAVDGSISLAGARIDDLHLRRYRETIDSESPEITLMSPSASLEARYAELGWRPARGTNSAVPTSTTIWTPINPDAALTPETPVTLIWSNGEGLSFSRTISVDENYMFTVTQSVTNSTSAPVSLHPYGLVARRGEPEGQRFWISYEGPFGYLDSSRRDASYKDLRDEGARDFTSSDGWLGITDKYWMTVLVPPQNSEYVGRFTYRDAPGGEIFQADYIMNAEVVPPGGSVEVSSNLFAGAKVVSLIDEYRDELGIQRFDLAMDWGCFFFLTKPFFWALSHLGNLVGNFGVAILIFTVLIKLVFFPLANKSYESMSKMRKVQPEMEKLRERHKDDKMKQQQELMELYKREKLNPLAGCLPMLIQIPVFFALYQTLFVTIEMRHAPFFGWIRDLSAPDPTTIFNLFGLMPWTSGDLAAIPLIGAFLTIGVWPLVMGFSMWFQMQLNPPPPDPIQRRMFQLMPIFFMFLLANFAAGLVIYWAWNNMLSILQQTVIMKRMGTFENPLGRIGLPAFVRNALPAGFGAGAGSGTVSVSPDAEGDEAESASDPFLGEEGDVLTARDDEPDDEADDEVSPKNESD